MSGRTEVVTTAPEKGSREWAKAASTLASRFLGHLQWDARMASERLADLKHLGAWSLLLDGEPRTWERFCAEVLGHEPGFVGYVLDNAERLEGVTHADAVAAHAVALAERAEPLAQVGGDRRSEARSDQGSLRTLVGRGEGSDYLTRRIARDRPDLLERMKAGEFPSVRAAALEAGIVKPRWSAPCDPQALGKALAKRFGPEELDAMLRELGIARAGEEGRAC